MISDSMLGIYWCLLSLCHLHKFVVLTNIEAGDSYCTTTTAILDRSRDLPTSTSKVKLQSKVNESVMF